MMLLICMVKELLLFVVCYLQPGGEVIFAYGNDILLTPFFPLQFVSLKCATFDLELSSLAMFWDSLGFS